MIRIGVRATLIAPPWSSSRPQSQFGPPPPILSSRLSLAACSVRHSCTPARERNFASRHGRLDPPVYQRHGPPPAGHLGQDARRLHRGQRCVLHPRLPRLPSLLLHPGRLMLTISGLLFVLPLAFMSSSSLSLEHDHSTCNPLPPSNLALPSQVQQVSLQARTRPARSRSPVERRDDLVRPRPLCSRRRVIGGLVVQKEGVGVDGGGQEGSAVRSSARGGGRQRWRTGVRGEAQAQGGQGCKETREGGGLQAVVLAGCRRGQQLLAQGQGEGRREA